VIGGAKLAIARKDEDRMSGKKKLRKDLDQANIAQAFKTTIVNMAGTHWVYPKDSRRTLHRDQGTKLDKKAPTKKERRGKKGEG